MAPLCSAQAQSSEIVVKGDIVDRNDQPIIGATVVLKGSTKGVVTGPEGRFEMKVAPGSVLTVSYVGYITQEVSVGNSRQLRIVLEEDTKNIEEIVVVGYGTQTRGTVTGAVSTLKSDDILKSPAANVSGALAGRMTGIMTKQSSGMPGDDGTAIRIRGLGTYTGEGGVLVLVDGVEREYTSLDPEEIESFSVLKDAASTAVYGIRGANGVLLVTTKRGKQGPAKVSFTANLALLSPTRLPNPVNSYDYAMLRNEGLVNDAGGDESARAYDQVALDKYRDHSDPLFYPDADWFDLTTRKFSMQQKYNVNVSGGTQFARYYVSLGFLTQDGIQKEFNQAYGYSNRDSYRRLNVRSNIDMQVTKTTVVSLSLGLVNGKKNRLSDDNNSIWAYAAQTPPNVTPGIWDGRYVVLEDAVTKRNPIYELTRGMRERFENNMNATLEIKQDLSFITPGLQFKAKGAFDNQYVVTNSRSKTEQLFYPSRGTDENGEETIYYYSETEPGQLGGMSNNYGNRMKRYYGEISLTYDRTFGKHSISVLALANASKKHYTASTYPETPTGYLEAVARVAYNYDRKYLFEFNFGVNGSENFPKSGRFGYFPAFSLGWVLSNEKFFQDHVPASILSYVKFRASYGVTGNDRLGNRRFMYYPNKFNQYGSGYNSGVYYGESPVAVGSFWEATPGTPQITWETATKQNYAVELKFLRDRLSLTAEYFFDKRDNILSSLNTQPFLAGLQSGSYNIGKTENKGYEFEAGWNHTIGKVSYYIKGNYSFARNKIVYMDEAKNMENPHLWQTGRRIGEIFGYVQEGFFRDQADIDAWPSQFGVTLRPGDVKYRDVNGDGVVDIYDQVPIGHPNFPEIGYGFSAGISYRNFDVSVLFQGAANCSITLQNQYQKPFDNLGTVFDFWRDGRWTPETAETARFPRMSVNHSQAQNYYNSSLWVLDASYLRLKNVEIGYTFPRKLIQKVRLSGLRIYVSAQNLYTWDNLDGITDPENKASQVMNYPQQRIFNFGVNLKF